ncbi:MAG: hypothetical protein CSA26_05665 [Desulfobacterales bacterium]|nr:MAG: hypothetical protein CSA26_05665 [Desulfobacterales bacterium]
MTGTTMSSLLRNYAVLLPAILLLPICSLAASETSEEKHWTIEKAVVFALTNSPDSSIARQRITEAAAMLQLAQTAFRPRLTLTASYDQTDTPMYSFGNILNQGDFNNTIDFNDPGRTDNLNLKAAVTYRLYNGGQDQASVNSARSSQRASKLQATVTEHRLGFEVVRAALRIIQTQEQIEAREAELNAINESLSVAQARYEVGDLLRTEILNIEVEQSRITEQLILDRHAHELAGKIFLNLLGLEDGTPVIVSKEEDIQQLPAQSARNRRPEIAVMEAQINAAEAALKKEEGSRYPTIDGYLSYRYDQGLIDNGSGDSWSAGIRVNYLLYDGDGVSASIAAKKAVLTRLKEQLVKLKLEINLEFQKAELSYRQAVERRHVTSKMLEVARESAQLSRERFREGVILTSDLIDAEARLTEALLRQSAARSQYQVAIANLRHAAGLQQFTETTEMLLEDQK